MMTKDPLNNDKTNIKHPEQELTILPPGYPSASVKIGRVTSAGLAFGSLVLILRGFVGTEVGFWRNILSITLLLGTAGLLHQAYDLMGKLQHRKQSLWLLVAALPLWCFILLTTLPASRLTEAAILGTIVGGSFFIWRPVWFL